MNEKDIRWKQRFQNFEKTMLLLRDSLGEKNPDVTHRAGIIQFFEMAFELSWKTLKDYLEQESGYVELKSPRSVLKQAFQDSIISDGHLWMEILDDRNLTAHTYDEATAIKVDKLIRDKYFPLLENLFLKMKNNFE